MKIFVYFRLFLFYLQKTQWIIMMITIPLLTRQFDKQQHHPCLYFIFFLLFEFLHRIYFSSNQPTHNEYNPFANSTIPARV
jgi:hypothetical protein